MATLRAADQVERSPGTPGELEVPASTGWPLVLAFGFTLVFAGLLTDVSVSILGAVLALAIAALINHAGLSWIPPGNATAVPLRLDFAGRAALVGGAWLGLAVVTTLAALLPANRAARLPVVDALRHV